MGSFQHDPQGDLDRLCQADLHHALAAFFRDVVGIEPGAWEVCVSSGFDYEVGLIEHGTRHHQSPVGVFARVMQGCLFGEHVQLG
ncbi:MAG TPA: hypothetical protein EYP98_01200 [Planctomycetes bacterium]|nr:hypothetical protein [Planctomycetota bacterium]